MSGKSVVIVMALFCHRSTPLFPIRSSRVVGKNSNMLDRGAKGAAQVLPRQGSTIWSQKCISNTVFRSTFVYTAGSGDGRSRDENVELLCGSEQGG